MDYRHVLLQKMVHKIINSIFLCFLLSSLYSSFLSYALNPLLYFLIFPLEILLTQGPQAALMGGFAVAGSLSRILLPIASGYLDRLVDNSPFNIVLMLLSVAYLSIILSKRSMKQYIVVDYLTLDKTKKNNEEAIDKKKRELMKKKGEGEGEKDEEGEGKDVTKKVSNNCLSWMIRKFSHFFRLLYNLSWIDKIHAIVMIFLIVLSIVDLISIAGGIRNNKGFEINEDQGLDVD